MTVFNEVYTLQTRNSAISASAKEAFGQDTSSRENKNKYGSFNSAVIFVSNTDGATIQFNGNANESYPLNQPGTIRVHPEEGKFFDWVAVLNETGSEIAANKVDVKLAIAKVVQNG